MGFVLPSGVVNTHSLYVYAVSPIAPLGPYVKQPADQVLVTVDYIAITPPFTLTSYTFATDVSSNPQLVISLPQIDATGHMLTFLLSGGIAGQQYNITINANSNARVDNLIISIPSFGDQACDVINPVPSIYNQIPLWGGGYVNTAVRLFWGPVAPNAPNALDQWYDTTNNILCEWITDGTDYFWWEL